MEIDVLINRLNREKEQLITEINEKQTKLNELDIVIKNLIQYKQDLTVMCPNCNGKGKTFRRACAEDEGDYYTCNKCNGEGRIGI